MGELPMQTRKCPSCGSDVLIPIQTRDRHGTRLIHIVQSGSIIPCPKCGANLTNNSDISAISVLITLAVIIIFGVGTCMIIARFS